NGAAESTTTQLKAARRATQSNNGCKQAGSACVNEPPRTKCLQAIPSAFYTGPPRFKKEYGGPMVTKLSDPEAQSRVASVPGWTIENGELTRTFKLASFPAAL